MFPKESCNFTSYFCVVNVQNRCVSYTGSELFVVTRQVRHDDVVLVHEALSWRDKTLPVSNNSNSPHPVLFFGRTCL